MEKGTTFVGLDVHVSGITIAELRPGAVEPEMREIPNEPKVVRRTFKRLLERSHELRTCYEAGPCGFELHRILTGLGVGCDVVAPGLIPVRSGDRIKTDRRDAQKLARLYRSGELTAIRVPSADEEATRDLVRAREDVRRDLTAARNRLSTFLLRHGRIYGPGTAWTQRYWRWLREQTFEREPERITYEHYLLQVDHLTNRKEMLEKAIGALAATPAYANAVGRLTSLRGISVLSAMVLMAEIQQFQRFRSPRELMAFVGLVPSEYSSGGREKRGRITKSGNSHARRVLVEAAWAYRHRPGVGPRARRAAANQPPEILTRVAKAQQRLHGKYARLIGRGKRSQLAATAVARELCGFVWSVMVA